MNITDRRQSQDQSSVANQAAPDNLPCDSVNSAINSLLEPKGGCIAAAMEIIGNKWTALILRDLAAGPQRFCELEKSVGTINPRTLSQRLDDLESHGIISKDMCTDSLSRPEYSLTDKGRDLLPVLQQMAAWGAKHYDSEPRVA